MKIITEEDYINIANYIIRNIKSYGEEWNLPLNDLIVKLKSMKINFVDNISDLYLLKGGVCVAYYCKQCGDIYFSPNSFRVHKIPTFSKFLCFRCLRKQTNIEHFGTDNPMKNKDIIAKGQETWSKKSPEELQNIYNRVAETRKNKTQEEKDEIKRKVKESKLRNSGNPNAGCYGSKEFKAGMIKKYGVDVPAKNREIAARISSTLLSRTQEEKQATRNKTITNNLAKYGYEWHTQVPEIKNKIDAGLIKSIGVKRPIQDQQKRAEIEQSMLDRYGAKTTMESPILKARVEQTNLKRYGSPCVFGNKTIRDKGRLKMLEETGKDHPIVSKINYYGILFDSMWELAVWIYARDHNEFIIREPISIEYEFNNEIHKVYPDFYYRNKLIEIKGNHLYGDSQFNARDTEKHKAKHAAEMQRGVEFWFEDDVNPFIQYVKSTYGINYMKMFYSTNPFNPSYNGPYGYVPIIKPYTQMNLPYTENIFIGKGITPFDSKPDIDGFIMSDKSITPFDIK